MFLGVLQRTRRGATGIVFLLAAFHAVDVTDGAASDPPTAPTVRQHEWQNALCCLRRALAWDSGAGLLH